VGTSVDSELTFEIVAACPYLLDYWFVIDACLADNDGVLFTSCCIHDEFLFKRSRDQSGSEYRLLRVFGVNIVCSIRELHHRVETPAVKLAISCDSE
jgi:hypothetical protein